MKIHFNKLFKKTKTGFVTLKPVSITCVNLTSGVEIPTGESFGGVDLKLFENKYLLVEEDKILGAYR